MDPENTPSLDHGIPAPESYLPENPLWHSWPHALAIFLLSLSLIWLFRYFRKEKITPSPPPEKDFYATALQSLQQLEAQCETQALAKIAAHCSLAIRSYLASSHSDPALYQTTEEFEAQQVRLSPKITTLLANLNASKYDRSSIDPARARHFLKESQHCLTEVHTAQNLPK